MKKILTVILVKQEKTGYVDGDYCIIGNHHSVSVKDMKANRSVAQNVYLVEDRFPIFNELVYSVRGIIGRFGRFDNSYANECRPLVAAHPYCIGTLRIPPEMLQAIADNKGMCDIECETACEGIKLSAVPETANENVIYAESVEVFRETAGGYIVGNVVKWDYNPLDYYRLKAMSDAAGKIFHMENDLSDSKQMEEQVEHIADDGPVAEPASDVVAEMRFTDEKWMRNAAREYEDRMNQAYGSAPINPVTAFIAGANFWKKISERHGIHFAEFLLRDYEMGKFSQEELTKRGIDPDDNLCWILAGTEQKYLTEELYTVWEKQAE